MRVSAAARTRWRTGWRTKKSPPGQAGKRFAGLKHRKQLDEFYDKGIVFGKF